MKEQQTKKTLGLESKLNFGATPSFKKTEVYTKSIDKAAKNMTKNNSTMKRLTIDVEGDLHNRLKIWSVNTGISMREISVEFYELLCSGNVESIDDLRDKLS
jgi:hypothetical protein